MPYQLQLSVESHLVSAVLSGLEHHTDAEEAWAEIREAACKHEIKRILAEIHLHHPIPTAELYQFGQAFSQLKWPSGTSIAVVCDERYAGDCRFTETVISNRCPVRSKGFWDRKEAVAWLSSGSA